MILLVVDSSNVLKNREITLKMLSKNMYNYLGINNLVVFSTIHKGMINSSYQNIKSLINY